MKDLEQRARPIAWFLFVDVMTDLSELGEATPDFNNEQ
jgi:hypothetical protein